MFGRVLWYLIHFSLEDNKLGAVGTGIVADALSENDYLTGFWFQSNKINDNGAAALAEALKINTTLVEL